jgi:hypothetical protein
MALLRAQIELPLFFCLYQLYQKDIETMLQEEELRCSGDPKFSHLSDDLHVEITAFAPPAEAHARIAYALAEVRRFLVPVSNRICRWRLHLHVDNLMLLLTS